MVGLKYPKGETEQIFLCVRIESTRIISIKIKIDKIIIA